MKTTTIALCDCLLKAGWVKNILFLADRNSLVTQAKRSFVNMLPNLSCTNLVEEKDNYNAHCVFSTYQTMINCIDTISDKEGKLFTCGHFDLVICDEAHRSIYNKYYIRQHQDNIAIAKLKRNKPLTSTDIAMLEEVLWSEVGTKQDYEQEFGEKPLGEFVREIVGLDMNAAKEAFSEYLTNASLDSRQIYFVNQIVEYIVHNGMMKDLSVLQESPFTDRGSVVEIFTDLSVWMGIRKVIDMINANAVA